MYKIFTLQLRIIWQRRKFENKDTYLAFFGHKKKKKKKKKHMTQDSDPINNILMMIHHLGIRDMWSKFIENLYLSSMAYVKGWWTIIGIIY